MDAIPVSVVNPIPEAAEAYRPYSGATSLKDALALRDAKESLWDIGDLWYMVQDIIGNVMSDDSITDKASAINSLVDEFKKEIKAKSESVNQTKTLVRKEVNKSKFEETVLMAISELKSLVVPKPVIAHPLDASISELKSEFDRLSEISNISPAEKLKSIQESYAKIGETIVEFITPKKVETQSEAKDVPNLGTAFADALKPILDKLELVSTQLGELRPREKTTPVIPDRLRIDPKLVVESEAKPVVSSPTPNLRAMLERNAAKVRQ